MKEPSVMMRHTLAAALFLTLLPLSSAFAATEGGKYAIKGVGVVSCRNYTDERDKKSNHFFQFVGWVSGYLSGYNRLAAETADIAPWQSTELLAAFIGNFCKKNPDARLAEATNELIKALEPGRLRDTSERVKVEAIGKSVMVYKAVLQRAQEILAEAGHYRGEVDGQFDPVTQEAFESYQRAQGLEITGLPDQRTLLSLFR